MCAKEATYVLYVGAGKEAKTSRLIERMVDHSLYKEIFTPRYEKRIKRTGVWRTTEAAWVPGYVFFVTDAPLAFRDAMRSVPAITKVVGMGAEIVPLGENETQWIERLTKPGERKVDFSEGYIEGDNIIVTSGPLAGFESEIIKIDRHKRMAYIRFGIGTASKTAQVGLEIVAKKK